MREKQTIEGVNPVLRWKDSTGNLSRVGHLGSIGAVIALMVGCAKAPQTVMPVPTVEVVEVTSAGVPMSTEIIGQLDSPQNVEIRARIEAFVEEVLFIEGTEVKAGDPLFKLDDKPTRERLSAANGLLAEAKAALRKYETDVARLTPLAEKRAIPQQDLDNALASVDVGKANVISAQAHVESAQFDLGYCDVRAPVSGLIGAKQVSVGELVGKGEPTLLATISTLDPIWFYCNVSETQYLRAQSEIRLTGRRLGDLPIDLILADGSVHPGRGKIVFVDRAVDVKTGTIRLRAEFPNLDKSLRPGMFGRIRVNLGVRADSILIPQRAVQELQGKNFVWVVGEGNKASQRSIKAGAQIESGWLVDEGLKVGERIIVEGVQKVREGGVVNPMTAAPGPAKEKE